MRISSSSNLGEDLAPIHHPVVTISTGNFASCLWQKYSTGSLASVPAMPTLSQSAYEILLAVSPLPLQTSVKTLSMPSSGGQPAHPLSFFFLQLRNGCRKLPTSESPIHRARSIQLCLRRANLPTVFRVALTLLVFFLLSSGRSLCFRRNRGSSSTLALVLLPLLWPTFAPLPWP